MPWWLRIRVGPGGLGRWLSEPALWWTFWDLGGLGLRDGRDGGHKEWDLGDVSRSMATALRGAGGTWGTSAVDLGDVLADRASGVRVRTPRGKQRFWVRERPVGGHAGSVAKTHGVHAFRGWFREYRAGQDVQADGDVSTAIGKVIRFGNL